MSRAASFSFHAAVGAAFLSALAGCRADEPPPASGDASGTADTPRDAAREPLKLAVAESESAAAAAQTAPAADAPVLEPDSRAPLPIPVATLSARAELMPTAGHEAAGTVEFFLAQSSMAINVELTGLKPGMHGFHVHEHGDCGGLNAGSAGGHLNPHGSKHGDPTDADDRHHTGDLGNVRAEPDGTVKQWLRTENLTLQGPTGILGKALVVHAREDDLKSQPAGESGEPVACGVIKATAW
jgi:Cu-Zn family superoxide dismutase